MIDAQGQPRTVEFNCRMGDPETQPILMRLKSDLFEVLMHATDGTLDQVELQWDRRVALGVVMAAARLPADAAQGRRHHRPAAPSADDAMVFHAGTALRRRPLRHRAAAACCASPRSATRSSWRSSAPTRCSHGIHFDGAQYRRDIGHRAIKR